MVFKYHIKEIILSFLLIFMLFVNIVLVFDKIIFVPRTKPPYLCSQIQTIYNYICNEKQIILSYWSSTSIKLHQ